MAERIVGRDAALAEVARARDAGETPNLRGADLSEANLRGARLVGANLREANLIGADLPDGWTIRSWIGAGSERRMTTLAVHPGGHTVWCGCFTGNVDEFAAAVETTHADGPLHLEDYREIVASMRRILAREAALGNPAHDNAQEATQ